MKRRRLCSDCRQWAAALLCGLLLVSLPEMLWAAAYPPVAVDGRKKVKKHVVKHTVSHKAASKKARRLHQQHRHWRPAEAAAPADLTDLHRADDAGLRGLASFYSRRFNGRRSATGERIDPLALTAASNHFPLGSRVAVSRADTGHCVIVKVNDRMHAQQRRVIDLSRSAAESLDMIRAGVVPVRVALFNDSYQQQTCRNAVNAALD